MKVLLTVPLVLLGVFAVSVNIIGGLVGLAAGAFAAKYLRGYRVFEDKQKLQLVLLWIVLLAIAGSMAKPTLEVAVVSFLLAFGIGFVSSCIGVWLNREGVEKS